MSSKNVKRTNIPVSIRTRMERIHGYIKYCQRLEDAYKTKHEEVRVLNDYLKRIQRVLPENVSEKCPEVEDIVSYIEGLPDVPDTDDLNETLKRMIDQQTIWREESTRNYNLINRKIEKMTEARDIVSVTDDSNKTKAVNKTKKTQTKKVNNKKTKVPPGKSLQFKLVEKPTVKSNGMNKILRRNAIRTKKTQTLGKTK